MKELVPVIQLTELAAHFGRDWKRSMNTNTLPPAARFLLEYIMPYVTQSKQFNFPVSLSEHITQLNKNHIPTTLRHVILGTSLIRQILARVNLSFQTLYCIITVHQGNTFPHS